MGKTKPGEEKKPPLDPELAKQRMQFLMSGVPEELKKQSAKTQAAVVPTDYPPLPTVSHVLQVQLCFAAYFEPPRDKTNKMTVRPAKTQISLGICPD